MSDKNDACDRCGNQPYYDGHEPWCEALSIVEEKVYDRIAALEEEIRQHRHRVQADGDLRMVTTVPKGGLT